MTEEADEFEWLRWFAIAADFGPSHGDTMVWYMRRFEKETGKRIPEQWRDYLTEAEGYEKDNSLGE